MDDKQQVESLYKQMYRAMIAKDTATMTGRSRVNAAVYGGGRHTWRLQIKSTLVRKDGRWLFVEQRASTYRRASPTNPVAPVSIIFIRCLIYVANLLNFSEI